MFRSAVLSVLLTLTAGVTPVANAAQPQAPASGGITHIEITRTESPTFEGHAFGSVGQYEKLVGRAYGEVDPNDPTQRHHHRSQPGPPEYAVAWSSTSPTSTS